MNANLKLVLANIAVAAALFYRWKMGAPLGLLIIMGVVVFALVNVLLILTQKKFNRPNR